MNALLRHSLIARRRFVLVLCLLLTAVLGCMAKTQPGTLVWSNSDPSANGSTVTITTQVIGQLGTLPTGTVSLLDSNTQLTSATLSSTSARVNYLLYSSQLGNSIWATQNDASLSASVCGAPAWDCAGARLTLPPNGLFYQQVNGMAGKTVTFSLWLQSNRADVHDVAISIVEQGASTVYGTTACAVSVSTWQRCAVTATIPGRGTAIYAAIQNTSPTVWDLNMWGPQLEIATSMGPYTPTAGLVLSSTARTTSYTTKALSAATHVLMAQYTGDGNYNPSASLPFNQMVQRNSVLLWTSAEPSLYLQPLWINAQVFGSSPTPTGTVSWLDGGSSINPPLPLVAAVSNTNLLRYSSQFDNAIWTLQTGASLIANYGPSPLGDNTGYRLQADPESVALYQQVSGTAGNTVTFSVWIDSTGSATSNVLLSVQEQGFTSSYGGASCPVSNNNRWQRCTVTADIPPSSIAVYASLSSGDSNPLDVSLWGAQLEIATAAGPYTPTAAAPASSSVATVKLRKDSLSIGTHNLSVVYSGDANYHTYTSSILAQIIQVD